MAARGARNTTWQATEEQPLEILSILVDRALVATVFAEDVADTGNTVQHSRKFVGDSHVELVNSLPFRILCC